MDLRTVGIIAALGSAASWAVGAILFKRIGEKVSPFGLTLSKGLVSVILLGVAVALTGFHSMSAYAIILLFLSGLLGIAVGDTLFFAALQDLGPTTLVVFFLLGNIQTALFGVLFLGEMPAFLAWIGIVLTLLGIAMVMWAKIDGSQGMRKTGIRGFLLGLLSMMAFSFSTIIAKKGLVEDEIASTAIWAALVTTLWPTFIRMAAGTLGMFTYGVAMRKLGGWLAPFRNRNTLALLVVSVLVVTFGGFWLTLVAWKLLDVAVASTLSATQPLFTIPLALLLLKERITSKEVGGTLLSVCGIVLLSIS